MKKIFLFIVLMCAFKSYAQQLYDSTKRFQIQNINAAGYLYKIVGAQDGGVILLPRVAPDKLAYADSGAIAFRNGVPIFWDGIQWINIGTGGGSSTPPPVVVADNRYVKLTLYGEGVGDEQDTLLLTFSDTLNFHSTNAFFDSVANFHVKSATVQFENLETEGASPTNIAVIDASGFIKKYPIASLTGTDDLQNVSARGNTTNSGLFVTDGTTGIFNGLNHQDYFKDDPADDYTEVRWDYVVGHHYIQFPVQTNTEDTFALLSNIRAATSAGDLIAWHGTGDGGRTEGVDNKLGTIDAVPLQIIVNNLQAGLWDYNDNNFYLGYRAGENQAASGFEENTAVGQTSQISCSSCVGNTSLGWQSLSSLVSGTYNTAIGKESLPSATGDQNTAIGTITGQNITTGDNNTLIGYGADVLDGTINNATAIGAGAVASQSNTMILGDTVLVNVGIGKTTPQYKLDVAGDVNVSGNFKINGVNISTSSQITDVQTLTATAGQTAFTFTGVPATVSDYMIFRNGNYLTGGLSSNVLGFTVSGNIVTITACAAGDLIVLHRIK